MRRTVLVCLALTLSLCLTSSAFARDRGTGLSETELEILSRQLETLTLELMGEPIGRVELRELGGDLYSLSVPLGDRVVSQAASREFRLLAVGQQRSIPANPRSLSNAVLINTRTNLNFWWATFNGTPSDVTAETKLTVKKNRVVFLGQTEQLVYPARTLTLYWEGTTRPLDDAGTYTVKVKVSGGGNRRTSFRAE